MPTRKEIAIRGRAVELGVPSEELMLWGREVLESQHGKAGRMRMTQNPEVAEEDVGN